MQGEVSDLLVRQLFAALGCNIAWGLVDAVMFILAGLAEKGRGITILNFLRKTDYPEKAREYIADALPTVVSSVIETESLENIRKALLKLPESSLRVKVTSKDVKVAAEIFLLGKPVTSGYVCQASYAIVIRWRPAWGWLGHPLGGPNSGDPHR